MSETKFSGATMTINGAKVPLKDIVLGAARLAQQAARDGASTGEAQRG